MKTIIKVVCLAALVGSCAGDALQYFAESSTASLAAKKSTQKEFFRIVCGTQDLHAIDFDRYEPITTKSTKTLKQYEDFRNIQVVFEPQIGQSRSEAVWTSLYFDNESRPETFPTRCDVSNPPSYGIFGDRIGRINIARLHMGKEILDFGVLKYECSGTNSVRSENSKCDGELVFQQYRLPIPVSCHSEPISNRSLVHNAGDDDDDAECEQL